MMGKAIGPGNSTAVRIAVLAALAFSSSAQAAGIPTASSLEELVVTARRIGLIGESRAASEGVVPGIQLEGRPVLRTGEVLEMVPGLVVTQHSGDGKANQYFLRGFNLDHGTDLATSVDGMPVNMHTHGHGQGYTDINFLIPELLDASSTTKGTYYADEGNFSAAGAVDLKYRRSSTTLCCRSRWAKTVLPRAGCGVARNVRGATCSGGLDYGDAATGPGTCRRTCARSTRS